MQKIIVLYDKDDVIEFNNNNKNSKNVFLFSPGLEFFLKNKENINIIRSNENSNSLIQKRIITNSKKIHEEFEKNIHILKEFDKGIIENINNITYVSIFSFMYLIENLKQYSNFKLYYHKNWHEFENFENFISLFLEKVFFKRSQGFFNYLRPKKISRTKKLAIQLSNKFCKLGKKFNTRLVAGNLLTKKIFKEINEESEIFQLNSPYDFKTNHLILNFFNFFNFLKDKKIFYFFAIEEDYSKEVLLEKKLEIFFNSFNDKNFAYFKKIVLSSVKKYCIKQIKLKKSVLDLVDFIKPKYVFVDQLRFGVNTVLASICNSKKIDVILVPHGSISTPDDEFSNFILPICARGLIYSKLATFAVAQSKISYEAIKYYDNKLKVLKSKPLLFGQNILIKNLHKKKCFTFLHASTPKSLSKWPWIYENYNEYVDNINELIVSLKFQKDVELVIRFREGPECDLKTFKKLININQNAFVTISKNSNFFDDLAFSNCLISFSSTSIEEALFLNKKVLVYSGKREYKHVNYKFKIDSDIIYSNQKNIKQKLDIVLNDNKKLNYDILWSDQINNNEDLKRFYF
jgi:hypothetical protein